MAIVQISRITNRKGLEADLPQPLAGAELGWAIDERRLWIGNGELAEGAPAVGNTEILTQWSDILSFANNYTYKGQAAGYTVQTGPTPGTPITQSLQSRLDSYAVVTDFGAVGDGSTDDTAAINRALYQLYCVQSNPAVRRSLFFPAGIYLITAPLLIPPYATLYGDGVNGSIIHMAVQQWTSGVAYQQGVLVQFNGEYYRSLIPVPVNISISNATYWIQDQEPIAVAQTADSLQQIGIEIGTNGAVSPRSITVSNLEFSTDLEINALLIENAQNCSLNNVSFQGPLTQTVIDSYANTSTVVAGNFVVGSEYQIVTLGDTDWNTAAGTNGVVYNVGDIFTAVTIGSGTGTADFVPPQISGIAWASTVADVCQSVTIDGCQFNGFWSGIATDQQIKGVTISNSSFDTLYRGVYLGGVSPENGGATGVKVIHNTFDNIYHQGVLFENVSLNATGHNVFYDVGNDFNGVNFPTTAVVEFTSANNVSIGDMFERTDAVVEANPTLPRVDINATSSIATVNGSQLQLGTYTRLSGLQATLTDNVSNTTLFTVDAAQTRAFSFDYTVVRNFANVRTGVFTVVASTDGTGATLVTNDTGVQNSSTGVTFDAVESGSIVTVRYSTTSTGFVATLNYSVTKLA